MVYTEGSGGNYRQTPYGKTFEHLSGWTFDRKNQLQEALRRDRLRRDLELSVEIDRQRHKEAKEVGKRVNFSRKLEHLHDFEDCLREFCLCVAVEQ